MGGKAWKAFPVQPLFGPLAFQVRCPGGSASQAILPGCQQWIAAGGEQILASGILDGGAVVAQQGRQARGIQAAQHWPRRRWQRIERFFNNILADRLDRFLQENVGNVENIGSWIISPPAHIRQGGQVLGRAFAGCHHAEGYALFFHFERQAGQIARAHPTIRHQNDVLAPGLNTFQRLVGCYNASFQTGRAVSLKCSDGLFQRKHIHQRADPQGPIC